MIVFKEISRIVPIFLLVLAVAIGARFVATDAVNNTAQNSTIVASTAWAAKLVDHIPNIENILAGKQIASETIITQMDHRQPKAISSYRVYNSSGVLQIEREIGELKFSDALSIGQKASKNLNDITTKNYYYEQFQIDKELHNTYASSSIVPLINNDKIIGYVETLNVESSVFEKFRTQFSDVTLRFVILMLAAFLLPAILYLRRTDQLEKVSKRLRYNAEYDDLTGALNRSAFTKKMEKDIITARDRGYALAVHFIDLDRFKEINDTKGHEAGDEILSQSAKRLQTLLGPRDMLARLGGDEFVIIQPFFVGSSSKSTDLANKIVKILNKPFKFKNTSLQISASVGYSHFPRDGKQVDELLRTADLALYQAKSMGRSRALEFNSYMEEERQTRQSIEQILRSALENKLFYLNFQPFYDMKTSELRGFEALLRINDKRGKPISPDIFIPIAEEIGLIGDIGAWVLREACEIAKDWPKHIMVSVNLSPDQFQTHDMPLLVKEVLRSTGLKAKQLELEVTEGLLITDSEKVLNELKAIKLQGVAIALDDFGTGYSSLSYLWKFPFDKLKIDKSFISTIESDSSKTKEILSTIVALGKVLNMKVTAEGVETEQQAKLLRSYDCDLVQGYLYSRPLNVIDVAAELIRSFENLDKKQLKKQLKKPVKNTSAKSATVIKLKSLAN